MALAAFISFLIAHEPIIQMAMAPITLMPYSLDILITLSNTIL